MLGQSFLIFLFRIVISPVLIEKSLSGFYELIVRLFKFLATVAEHNVTLFLLGRL